MVSPNAIRQDVGSLLLPIAFGFVIDNSDFMHDPLVSFPGYALRRAANATAAELAARLAGVGLRQSDVSLLMLVAANPGTTSSALGRQLDIQRANMVPILKRLEDGGLIARAPIDGKSQGLALTDAGRAQARRRPQGHRAVRARAARARARRASRALAAGAERALALTPLAPFAAAT